MSKRRKVSRKKSARKFRRLANSTKRINVNAPMSRGGTRL